MPHRPISIACAVIFDENDRVLLVRKIGSSHFIQPGGKIEAGERPLDALEREIREELGSTLRETCYLGRFEDVAINESGRVVVAHVFTARIDGAPKPGAEIAEVDWFLPGGPWPRLIAPLTARGIFPVLRASMHAEGQGS